MKTQAAVLYEMGAPRPYAQSRPLHIQEVELSPPHAGEVLVEVASAGLCHSDLSVVNGTRPRAVPLVLGHEAAGIVREVGAGVTAVGPGDHVVFSYVPSCGRCAFCAAGRPALCERGSQANHAGSLLDGTTHFTDREGRRLHHHMGVSAFSHFTVAAEESLVPIHPEVPLEIAALFGCAVLTGVGAVLTTARVDPASSVAVFGLGGVGLSCVMGARVVGAVPLIAVDVVPAKLEIARRLGATHTVDGRSEDPASAIRDLTGGGVAYTFESVGHPDILAQAYEATRRGGTTVSIGLPPPDRRVAVLGVGLVADERTLRGSYMGSAVPRRDIPRLVALYRSGLLPVEALVSRMITLADLNGALDALDRSEVVRQVVRFGGEGRGERG